MAKNQAPQADEVDQLLALNKTTGTPSGGGRSGSAVDAFVREVRPIADAASRELGVDPSYLIGQWGLETGWGKSVIPGTNNYGNIKDFRGGGKSAKDNMTGSVDKYRAYGSPEDFAKDYAQLLRGQRYSSAMGSKDAQSFFSALKAGGYAEDPNYVRSGVRAAEMARNAMGGSSSGASLYPTRGEYIGNTEKVKAETAKREAIANEGYGASFARGFGDATDQIPEMAVGAGTALADVFGADGLREAGLEYLQKNKEAHQDDARPYSSFTDSLANGDMGRWASYALGYGANQLAQAVATGGVGATIGKVGLTGLLKGTAERATAEALAKGAAKEIAGKAGMQAAEIAARKYGAAFAMSGYTYGQELGSIYPDAVAQAKKTGNPVDLARVFGAAGVAAALEVAPEIGIAGKLIDGVGKGAKRMAGRAATTIPKQMGLEGGTEYLQTGAEQWGAQKPLDTPEAQKERIDSAAMGAIMGGPAGAIEAIPAPREDAAPGAVPGAAPGMPPVQPAIQPNSPLANAAGIAQAAAPQPAAVDPFDGRLSAMQSFVEDKAFIQALRGDPRYGKESVTDLLSAWAKARNPNLDPMVRENALSGLESFASSFVGPNTINPKGQTVNLGESDNAQPGQQVAPFQQPGGAVGPAITPDDGLTLNGEIITRPSTMAGANPNQISAPPVLGLPTEEALQAKRDADAAYEQAYQDLVKSESLGASDQDLAARQQAIREARDAREQADARMQEIERAIEGNRTQQTAEKRRAVLDAILADPATANPAARLAAELKRQGFRDTTPTQAELDTIQRFSDIKNAEVEPDIIPSSPNELDPYQARQERPQQPAKPRLTVEQIKQAIANGATLSKDVLTLPDGSRVKLKGPQIAAARQAILKKAQDGASNERPNAEVAPQAPESGSPVVQGSANAVDARAGAGAEPQDIMPAGVDTRVGQDAPDGNGGVADAVESVARIIHESIAENALKNIKKTLSQKVEKGLATRDQADESVERDRKTWANAPINDRTIRIAQSIIDKDARSLVGAWAKEGQGTYGNEGSMSAFEKITGVKLRRLNSAQRAKAIFDWAGWSEDQVAEDVSRRRSEMESRQKERQEKDDGATAEQAGRAQIKIRETGEVKTVREYIDGLIAEGYTEIRTTKRGAVTKTVLANSEGWGRYLSSGIVKDYAEVASRRSRAAAESTPADVSLADEGKTTQDAEPEAENVDPLDKEISDAAAHLADVLADVFGAKLNITGPQHTAADLLPAMQKVIGLLVQKGFKTFAQAVGQTARMLRDNGAGDHVEKITPRQWKAAYQFAADMPGVEGAESEEAVAALSADKVLAIVSGHVDKAKAEAEARTDTNPSDAQKTAENYRKGKFSWNGQTIAVENPKGSERTGKGEDGAEWRTVMPATYGYFLGTVGADKDHVDVFVGDTLDAPSFWVINQTQPDSAKFDEHKVVAGVTSADEAKRIYLDSFSDGFGDKVFSSIAGPYPVGELADVLPKLKAKKPFGVKKESPRDAHIRAKEEAYAARREGQSVPPKALAIVRTEAGKEFDKAEAIHKDPGQPAEAVTNPTNLKEGLAKIRKEKAAQATEADQEPIKNKTRDNADAGAGTADLIGARDIEIPAKAMRLLSDAEERDIVTVKSVGQSFENRLGIFNGGLHVPSEADIASQMKALSAARMGAEVEARAIGKYEAATARLIDQAIQHSAVGRTLSNVGTRKAAQAPAGAVTAGVQYRKAGVEFSNGAAAKLKEARDSAAFLEALRRRDSSRSSKGSVKSVADRLGLASPFAAQEPIKKTAASNPESAPIYFTPKQYHEARMKWVAQEYGLSDAEVRQGEDTIGKEAMTGKLRNVLAHVEAGVRPRSGEAIHKDPGQPAEAVTPAVVAESIRKSAANTPLDVKEAKAYLLAEIDKAILAAGDKSELEAELAREKAKEFDGKAMEKRGIGSKQIIAARDAFNALRDSNVAKTAASIGFVTFDVPGDGKFKVANSTAKLQEFRRKVETSPGFKNPAIKPPTMRSETNTGSYGPRDAILEGDYLNAYELAKLQDKPLVFSVGTNNQKPTAYTDTSTADGIIDGIAFVVGREATKDGKWFVIEPATGILLNKNGLPSKVAALTASKAITKGKEDGLRRVIADPAKAMPQSTLEAEWLAWAEKEEGVTREAPADDANQEEPTPEEPVEQEESVSSEPSAPIAESVTEDAGSEINPLDLTPKQYHAAKLKAVADEYSLTPAEVREDYDTDVQIGIHNQEWIDAVRDAFRDGSDIDANVLDRLHELRPGALASFMHDNPDARIPNGYQTPDARKVEKAEADARKDSERNAQSSIKQPTDLTGIFTGLASRGLAKNRAQKAAEAHPRAVQIAYVQDNFMDILTELEDSGRVTINCD